MSDRARCRVAQERLRSSFDAQRHTAATIHRPCQQNAERQRCESDAQERRPNATRHPRLPVVKPSRSSNAASMADPFPGVPSLALIRRAPACVLQYDPNACKTSGHSTGANHGRTTGTHMACAANGHRGHLSARIRARRKALSALCLAPCGVERASKFMLISCCIKPRHSGLLA